MNVKMLEMKELYTERNFAHIFEDFTSLCKYYVSVYYPET
jgi:hypothetical protein